VGSWTTAPSGFLRRSFWAAEIHFFDFFDSFDFFDFFHFFHFFDFCQKWGSA
jgi:hypothetical protein